MSGIQDQSVSNCQSSYSNGSTRKSCTLPCLHAGAQHPIPAAQFLSDRGAGRIDVGMIQGLYGRFVWRFLITTCCVSGVDMHRTMASGSADECKYG